MKHRTDASSRKPTNGRAPRPHRLSTLVIFASVAVVTASLIGLVSVRSQTTRLGYQIHDLREEALTLLSRRAELRVELQTLTAPERLLREADALGLKPVQRTWHVADLAQAPKALTATSSRAGGAR